MHINLCKLFNIYYKKEISKKHPKLVNENKEPITL